MNTREPTDVERYQENIDDLLKHQLLSKFSSWQRADWSDVVLLEKNRKTGEKKTIVVEKIEQDAIDKFLFHTVARACGVVVPKLRLKSTGEDVYAFKSDLSEQRGNTKAIAYSFHEILSHWTGAVKFTLGNIDKQHISNDRFHFPVDKESITRLSIISLITEIEYITKAYIHVKQDNKDMIKLGLRYFMFNDRMAVFDEYDEVSHVHYNECTSLLEVVAGYNQVSGGQYDASLHLWYVNEDDYRRAFDDIAPVFTKICDDAFAEAEKIPFAAAEQLQAAKKRMNGWKANLQRLQTFVNEIDQKLGNETAMKLM